MKKIYIVTTFTGTLLSCLIRNISKTPYAHVSIALNEYLRPMYSFGRLNPKTPIFAGFVEENINDENNFRNLIWERIICLKDKCKKYGVLQSDVRKTVERIVYDVKALVYLSVNKPRKKDYKYVCSHFVADMLKRSEINILDKEPHQVRPNDFYDLCDLELEYEGLLSNYYEKDKVHNIGDIVKI